jgi:tripartite-type tricarboxylate transporter receptor subunit TctC
VVTQINAGKLRAVAITSARRHVTLPQVATVAETIPGFEISQWIAMHAPRATPREVIERLNGAVTVISQSKGYRERMLAQGYDAEASTPQQLAARIVSELARFGKLIKAIGLKDDGV